MDSLHRHLAAVVSCSALVLSAAAFAGSPATANGVAPPGCDPTFSGGAGTSADPYLISSAADLTALNGDSDCWAGEFLQTANIDMNGATWSTTTGTAATPFRGTYDGGGFQISGLSIDIGDANDHGGLFGVVDSGTIRNLGFIELDPLNLTVDGGEYVGGLIGSLLSGTVSNSFTIVNVYADDDYAGGLVGSVDAGATIENSYATGTVEGDNFIGGLIGYSIYSTIADSYASGTVEGDDYVGGLVGGLVGVSGNTPSIVRGSHSSATVTSAGEKSGGLIGYVDEAQVVNSYATGSVTGDDLVGGLVGSVEGAGSVSGAYATGNVANAEDPTREIGGLIGYVESDASVTNCYATGSVSGGDSGGLIGENTGTVRNCYSTGSVSGVTVGGLIGTNTGTVTSSFWDVDTSEQTTSAGGTGKTTTEMRDLDTFTGAGWSIIKGWSSSSPPIWGLCAPMNNGYPFLNWSADVNPCGDGPFADFTFSLPNGEECTSISPMRATIGQQTRLPGADAACATMPGSKIIGWTVPAPADYTGIGSTAMPFEPGHLVNVVGAQQFTAVIWEPVIEFRYDANIATVDTCEPGEATHTSNDGRTSYVWVPRENFTDARFPTQAPCTPAGYELQAWNSDGDGTGTTYSPGNPLPKTWATDGANTHWLYAVWRPATAS